MASRVAIAIRREGAVDRLGAALKILFGETFILPTQGRDPNLLHAVQLEAIADYLERYAAQQRSPDAPPANESEIVDYSLMTRAELRRMAKARGLSVSASISKNRILILLGEYHETPPEDMN